MQAQHAQSNSLVTYAITAVVIAVVLAFRWRRMSRVTPLKLERLWVFPALYAVIAVATLVSLPPVGWGWAFCVLALIVGAVLGWQRGKFMRITVDPVTHQLNQTGSPAAMLFLVALVIVRSAARGLGGATVLHLSAAAMTDMLVALALGLFTATRIEMYVRAKRMLAGVRVIG